MISDFFTVVKFERATEWRASPGRCCHYATEPEPKDWFGRSETVHDSSHYSANSTWDSSFLLGIVQPEDMLWFPKRSTVAAWDGRCAVDRRVSDWKQWWAARRVFQDFAGRSCRSLAVTSSPAPGASLELMLTSHVILKISLYFGYISFCHISFCHISFGHICSKLCRQSYHNQSSLSSCPGLLVQMSDSQILVLQFSNLSCKTTLFFSPALISKVNNTLNGNFHKVKSRLAATSSPPAWWWCGSGEQQEDQPHGLHPHEVHQVDPDVLDDVGRVQDVPGHAQVTACFHPGTGWVSFGQVFA